VSSSRGKDPDVINIGAAAAVEGIDGEQVTDHLPGQTAISVSMGDRHPRRHRCPVASSRRGWERAALRWWKQITADHAWSRFGGTIAGPGGNLLRVTPFTNAR
jgi:hypothetical protein